MWKEKKIIGIINDESDITNYDDIVDTELQDTEIWDDSSNDYDED